MCPDSQVTFSSNAIRGAALPAVTTAAHAVTASRIPHAARTAYAPSSQKCMWCVVNPVARVRGQGPAGNVVTMPAGKMVAADGTPNLVRGGRNPAAAVTHSTCSTSVLFLCSACNFTEGQTEKPAKGVLRLTQSSRVHAGIHAEQPYACAHSRLQSLQVRIESAQAGSPGRGTRSE